MPKSSGSVIGVLWRYSTFGLMRRSAAPAIAAAIDPVLRMTNEAIAHAATLMDATDIAIADAPVRYHAST